MPTTASSTVTHKVLYNSDLIREILEFIAPCDSDHKISSKASRTLAVTARVCKSFCEPASTVLWRNLPALEPLLRILSTFTQTTRSVGGGTVFLYSISEPVSREEWVRLQGHAKSVQYLYFSPNEFDRHTFDVLESLSQGQPIFPRLRRLTWCQATFPYKECSFLFGPELLSFSIKHDRGSYVERNQPGSPDAERSVMEALVQRAPHLQSFSLDKAMISSAALDPLGALKDLQSFKVISIPSGAVVHGELFRSMSNMSHLRVLTLNVDAISARVLPPLGTFRRLKTFTISGSSVSTCGVLKELTAPRLQTLYLLDEYKGLRRKHSKNTWQSFQPCMVVIGSRFSKSLKALTFRRKVSVEVDEPSDSLHYLLEPLIGLSKLKHLTIEIDGTHSISLSDADFISVTKAWPMLESLTLSEINESDEESDMTFSSLSSLAQTCPKLTEVRLTNFPLYSAGDFTPDSNEISCHPLQVLVLGSLGDSDDTPPDPEPLVALAARWIDRLFPTLDVCECQDRAREYSLLTWRYVMDIVPLLQEVRADEVQRLKIPHYSPLNA